MTGFIRKFFGSKNNAPQQSQNGAAQPKRAAKPPKESKYYYLDPDSAKTFGDIDYMRTPKKVKHTFPKMSGAYEAEISAMNMQSKASSGMSATPSSSEAKPAAPKAAPEAKFSDRRQQDTSMDMFRNMARGMKR